MFGDSKYEISLPIGSMYGILAYIYHKNQPNVGKYTIHGSYGLWVMGFPISFSMGFPMFFVFFVWWVSLQGGPPQRMVIKMALWVITTLIPGTPGGVLNEWCRGAPTNHPEKGHPWHLGKVVLVLRV